MARPFSTPFLPLLVLVMLAASPARAQEPAEEPAETKPEPGSDQPEGQAGKDPAEGEPGKDPAEGEPGKDPPEQAGDPAAEAVAPPAKPVLDQLAAATTPDARRQAIDALAALDPVPVAELAEFLARKRVSSESERRALLAARGFDVPDDKGRFRAPGRQADKEEKANDQLDWLATLVTQPASPALSDVLADIAAIRALAASKQSKGAAAILKFAFRPDGIGYRDECGRYLRRMTPWSLPALIRAAEMTAGDKSRARYARYQLERLDRENPRKALSDAPTDELQVEILHTFAESQYREAVFVVLDNVDHVSPKVRQAAREAWMEYATGRPPKPAPKEKLQLPGGKLSEEEVPLWLDHRELADIAIRRRLEELTGKKPSKGAKLAELSEQLFQVHDRRQASRLDKVLAAGLAEAAAGKLAEATQRFDAILVQAPDFAKRGQMAEIYLRHGEALEKANKHREAATAFGKAHAVAPEGPIADQALANHHRARGHGLAAEGKKEVAAAALERASEIDQKVDARVAEAGRGDRKWMLVVGIVSGLAGIALLAMGLAWRRRSQWRAWRG